jgi:hypothetical protein
MTNTGQAEKGETHGRNDRERVKRPNDQRIC